MKSVIMKGKNVDEATEAGLAVLGISKDAANIRIINEGKPAVMGILGGEDAEVEVSSKGSPADEAKGVLQNILDKMGFLAVAEISSVSDEDVELSVKGEDMGRIIGKEGLMLKALETVVGAITWKIIGNKIRVHVDAGGYREKRVHVLESLAADIVEEVEKSGEEKVMPFMEAADRRIIHMFLKDNPKVTSFSRGEGKDRRMVIAPRK